MDDMFADVPPHPLGPYVRGPGGRPKQRTGPPSYRGGCTWIDAAGYVMEWCPGHPRLAGKAAKQHRLVMEGVLGRFLTNEEVVHHLNRIKTDNRPSNLEVTTRKAHGLEHRDESSTAQKAPLSEDEVRKALADRTTLQAAELLGVSHGTLRRRFDHLLVKRKSPGDDYPESLKDAVRALAADPEVSTRNAAQELGVSLLTLRKIRENAQVEWVSPRSGPRRL